MGRASEFFSQSEREKLVESIRLAETKTSGEIRVRVERRAMRSPEKRAQVVFRKLKMHITRERNAVLFYISTKDKQFSIYADKGINEKVPTDFWLGIAENLESAFKKGHYIEGLEEAIEATAEKLKAFFPCTGADENELPNEISMG